MDIAADLCLTSKGTAWRSIHETIHSLLKIRNNHIYFPDQSQFPAIESQFRHASNFPGVIGCVDGTHIPLKVPNNNQAELFRCRKGYKSLNVQMVCGPSPDNLIYDVDARWPGSTHDATVWAQSRFASRCHAIPSEFHLLGDSAYPSKTYLLTPYKMPESNYQKVYNYKQSSTRMAIEKCYGQLKRRFPKLKHGFEFKNPSDTANCIVATAVIYNICKRNYDEEIGEDINYEVDVLNGEIVNDNASEKRDLIARSFIL